MAVLTSRSKTAAWVGFGILAVCLIGLLVHKAWPVLFPEFVLVAPLDPECDLRAGSCTGVFPDGGELSFGIEPAGIPVLRDLTLTVRLEGLAAEGVEVDFAGTDMNMGYNRVPLREDAPGLWRGRAMLPICVRDVMSWEATLLLKSDEGLKAAPFRFDTYRARGTD